MRSALLLLLTTTAFAAPKDRFHILSPQLEKRLSADKRMRQSLAAVGNYKQQEGHVGGTVFLVTKPDAQGRALVLTNHHVALFIDGRVQGDRVLFHVGGATRTPARAKVLGKVAADKSLDYALLRVQLPSEMKNAQPVQLDATHEVAADEKVYNPSFPRIWKDERKDPGFVAGSKKRALYRAALAGRFQPKMLQRGLTEGYAVEGLEMLKLPNQEGASGSPVLSAKSHRVLGMLTAGSGTGMGLMRPIGTILRDLKGKQSSLSAADQAALRPLL